MRIAIISDIHSNLEALTRAFRLIDQNNIDAVVCTGDIVGYGANPNECVALIRQRTSHILRGNHDDAAVNLSRIDEFSSLAQMVAHWTNEVLHPDNKKFLQSLPLTLDLGDVFFTHASPYEPEEWHYIFSSEDAQNNFSWFVQPICFVGHTHRPVIHCDDGISLNVKRGKRYIINVGSIGQPRDFDWRLSFGIFDTLAWTYENVRAEYDVQSASDQIIAHGLPPALAERILFGR